VQISLPSDAQVLWWRLVDVDDKKLIVLVCRSECFQLRAKCDDELRKWRAAIFKLGLEPARGVLYHFLHDRNEVVTTTEPPVASSVVTCFRRAYECGYDPRQDQRRVWM
jgi:hypothetical protein